MDWFPYVYWSGFIIGNILTFYYYKNAKDGGLLPCMILIGFIWPVAFVISLVVILYGAKDSLEDWKNARRQANDSSGNKAG